MLFRPESGPPPNRNNIPVVFSIAGGLAAAVVAVTIQGFFTGFAYREFLYTTLVLSFIAKSIAKEYVAPAVTVPVAGTASRFRPALTTTATLIGGRQNVNLARASYTQAQASARRLRHSWEQRRT